MKSSNSGQLFGISDTKLVSVNNDNSKIVYPKCQLQLHNTPMKNYEILGPIAILQRQGKCSVVATIFLAYGHGAWLDLIGIIKDT